MCPFSRPRLMGHGRTAEIEHSRPESELLASRTCTLVHWETLKPAASHLHVATLVQQQQLLCAHATDRDGRRHAGLLL